jgi:hypothetical protein
MMKILLISIFLAVVICQALPGFKSTMNQKGLTYILDQTSSVLKTDLQNIKVPDYSEE